MTLHTKISYVKSGTRIVGYFGLLASVTFGVVVLVIAELLGMAEELPGAYKGTDTK